MYYVIFVFPVIAVLDLICYVPFALISSHRNGKKPFLRHLAIYGFLGVVLMILYATVFWYGLVLNFHPYYHMMNLTPFVWVRQTYAMGWGRMIEQLILNVMMFVPLGMFLPIVFRKMRSWWKTGVMGLIITVLIETLQYFTGRSADIDDVIANAFGCIIGYLIYKLIDCIAGSYSWWKKLKGIKK